MMKPITLKVDERQLRLLDQVSKATHIPKSALIRKGIALALQQTKEEVLSSEIRKQIDQIVTEDAELLRKLSEA